MPTGHYYPDYNADGLLSSHVLSDGLMAGGVWQGLYEQSLTQNFPIGTRLQIQDRTFYYAQAAAVGATTAMKAGHNDSVECSVNTYAEAYAAGYTGKIRIEDTDTRAAHYYQNGYVWVMNLVSGVYQFLKVKDSDAAEAADNHVHITLYDPLPFTIPASTWVTIHRNPYACVSFTTTNKMTMVGVPLIPVTANYYFWIQTWGPCFGTAMSAIPGAAANDRDIYFNSDGALINGLAATLGMQRAGYLLPNTTSGGDQFYQLQLAP